MYLRSRDHHTTQAAVSYVGTWMRQHAVRVGDYPCCPREVQW